MNNPNLFSIILAKFLNFKYQLLERNVVEEFPEYVEHGFRSELSFNFS